MTFRATARGRVIRKDAAPADEQPLEQPAAPVDGAPRDADPAPRPRMRFRVEPRRGRGRGAVRQAAREAASFGDALERRRNTPATPATTRIVPAELAEADKPSRAARSGLLGADEPGPSTPPTSSAPSSSAQPTRRPRPSRRPTIDPPEQPGPVERLGKGGRTDVEDMGGR